MNMFKLRMRWYYYAIKRWWYGFRWGIDMKPLEGSMLPQFGKGKYVSVYKKGGIIDVVAEDSKTPCYDFMNGRMVRLIPYQPNHGLMIEVWENGRMRCRHSCDIKQLAAAAGIDFYPSGKKPAPTAFEETATVG